MMETSRDKPSKSQRKRQKTPDERKGGSKGKTKQVDEELERDSATDIIETSLDKLRTSKPKQKRTTTEERRNKKQRTIVWFLH